MPTYLEIYSVFRVHAMLLHTRGQSYVLIIFAKVLSMFLQQVV